MALREEFESTGNWLFKRRGYLPVVFIAVVFYTMRHYHYLGHAESLDYVWEAICLLVSFTGLGIRIFTIGHTPWGTSGRNTKQQIADTLNTSGIYSTVRHPLYLGNFFMGLGIVLFPHLIWLTLAYVLFYCLYYERIMFAEEAFLRDKFGERFTQWAATTPAIIPDFRKYVRPDLAFSLKNVLKREYNGFFAAVLVFFALEVVGDRIVNGRFELDFYWAAALVLCCTIWLVLRTLKKRTRILHVNGR